MRSSVCSIALALIIAAGTHTVATSQNLSMKGRSALEVGIGFWTGSQASSSIGTGYLSEAKTSGFAGGLVYAYGLQESWALTVSAGLLSASASTQAGLLGVQQQASTVIPFLLGVRWFVTDPAPDTQIRPFLAAAVGPIMGMEAKNTILTQEARNETTFGGRIGAGVDFLLGPHVKLGLDVGYLGMAEFSAPVGARKNYNGADGALRVGYIF